LRREKGKNGKIKGIEINKKKCLMKRHAPIVMKERNMEKKNSERKNK